MHHWVHPKVGQRRQHGRRMMNFVEFPEKRYPVRQIVIEPVAKLVSQEQHDGDDGPGYERRQRRRRPRSECRGQEIGGAVADHFIRQQRPAEDDAEQKQIEIKVAEIREARLAHHDTLGEQRPQQRFQADAAALFVAPCGEDDERNEQRADEREQRGVRAGIKKRLAQLTKEIRKAWREIQARLRTSATAQQLAGHW
jgi:hypothetical protein